jgi:ATP-dependent DNA helicase RecQ
MVPIQVKPRKPVPGLRNALACPINLNSRCPLIELGIGVLADLNSILTTHFRLREFRKGQLSIIESVLSGQDTMAVMPTGGGKSLCYQLPALAMNRLVVVISPLIALMQDQVRSLKAMGIAAGCLNSGQTDDEKREVFREMNRGGAFILYLSPERAQKPGFAAWAEKQDIGLIAIDESHCVSQWGPDFRPDYGKLSLLRTLKPQTPLLALTATATPTVLEDIIVRLGMRQAERFVRGFYRPNLFYQVAVCETDEQKLAMVKAALRRVPDGRVLIYCGTRQGTEELAQELQNSPDSPKWADEVGFYHAGLAAIERSEIQKKLDRNELRIVCATNAFGMGIDYPDVRLVIHFQMPANIESFYQEMGRAGRDGKVSRCLLLYSKKDKGLQSFFIQQSKAEPQVINSKWRALDAMTQFAEGGECRHAGILTYFRDVDRIAKCGHCDICAPTSELVVARVEAKSARATRIRRAPISNTNDRSQILETDQAELRGEVLREWRKAFAARNDIPAFIVFSNRTLIDLANKNPKTQTELSRVYGFGPAKVEALGEEIMARLKECEGAS